MLKTMNRSLRILLLLVLAYMYPSTAALGATEAEAPTPAPASEPGVLDAAYSSVTRHSLEVGNALIEYTATAASITVADREETPAGRIFYIAYRLDEKAESNRPVTFVFNGGPGAASAYLHLGALGPRRVVFNEDGTTAPTPVQIADNPFTWLTFTDLVFVDPVGTGYSRAAEAGDNNNGEGAAGMEGPQAAAASNTKSQAWGVEEDADSMARFIRAYLTREDRWRSPVYLAGESYGGFRVARLSRLLQSDFGIAPSGLVLISPALDFSMLWGSDLSLWPWTALVPSYAAAAAVHGKGGPEDFSELDLRNSLADVERIALSDYISGLAGGEFTDDWFEEISRLTGLDTDTLSRFSGRVPISRFAKALLSDRRLILSLYDASITMVDPDPESQLLSSGDPYLDRINAPFTAGFNSYVREELKFKTDLPYLLLNADVNRAWNWQSGINGMQGYVESVEDLKYALSTNPDMRVLVVHGAYDLVTPYFSSEIAIRQMGLHSDIRDHIQLEVYPGGHMAYLRLESLEALSVDAGAFYRPESSP